MKNMTRVVDSNFDRLQARKGLTAKNNSQMGRILADLEAGAMPEASDEQKLEKLEARIEAVTALKARLSRMTVKLASLYTTDKVTQLKLLTAAHKAMQEMASSKPPQGMGKPLRACLNELVCLREGVYTGEAKGKKALTMIALGKAVEAADELLSVSGSRRTKLKASISAAAGDGLDDETEEAIKRNAKEKAKLPNVAERDYAVARAAVVPVLSKPVPSEVLIPALKRLGFSVDDLAGYPAIHNQLLIGINPARLQGKGKSKTTPLQAAEKVMAMLKKTMGRPLNFVIEKPSAYKGTTWFWVAPDNELNSLAKSFPGGRILIKEWGFSF